MKRSRQGWIGDPLRYNPGLEIKSCYQTLSIYLPISHLHVLLSRPSALRRMEDVSDELILKLKNAIGWFKRR